MASGKQPDEYLEKTEGKNQNGGATNYNQEGKR
jgi:hypothetical protein